MTLKRALRLPSIPQIRCPLICGLKGNTHDAPVTGFKTLYTCGFRDYGSDRRCGTYSATNGSKRMSYVKIRYHVCGSNARRQTSVFAHTPKIHRLYTCSTPLIHQPYTNNTPAKHRLHTKNPPAIHHSARRGRQGEKFSTNLSLRKCTGKLGCISNAIHNRVNLTLGKLRWLRKHLCCTSV